MEAGRWIKGERGKSTLTGNYPRLRSQPRAGGFLLNLLAGSRSRVVTNDESPLDTMGCHQQCKTIFLQVHCRTAINSIHKRLLIFYSTYFFKFTFIHIYCLCFFSYLCIFLPLPLHYNCNYQLSFRSSQKFLFLKKIAFTDCLFTGMNYWKPWHSTKFPRGLCIALSFITAYVSFIFITYCFYNVTTHRLSLNFFHVNEAAFIKF